MRYKPHWAPGTDYSAYRFFIRRLKAPGNGKPMEVPLARLPLMGFIYVTSGEVLIEADGFPYLCQPGHALIIPAGCPFTISYTNEASGYSGCFALSALSDMKAIRFLTKPVHQAFWFDEGVFMGELFNMLMSSFEKADDLFIEKGLDLFLSRIRSGQSLTIPAVVNGFLESVFNPEREIKTLAAYANAAGISENYLSRQVKRYTGRSVGAWIDIVRVIRAKKMLAGTSVPIIDVAARVGLEDQSYFSRFFKRETGQTPTEFRKSMQG